MSEEQEPDPRFGSELTYLQMLKNFQDSAGNIDGRRETFGSNVWFPDLGMSFPNFGSCSFSRKEAKQKSYTLQEEDVGQPYVRGEFLDIRINIDETNLFTELPKSICTYALALEAFAVERDLRPGVLIFNIGTVWSTEEEFESITDKLQTEISFPIHP